MKFVFPPRPTSRQLVWVLVPLAAILVGMGLAPALGIALPEKLASDIANGVMIAAIGLLLYNRKLRSDELKAAAAKAKAERDQESGGSEPGPG